MHWAKLSYLSFVSFRRLYYLGSFIGLPLLSFSSLPLCPSGLELELQGDRKPPLLSPLSCSKSESEPDFLLATARTPHTHVSVALCEIQISAEVTEGGDSRKWPAALDLYECGSRGGEKRETRDKGPVRGGRARRDEGESADVDIDVGVTVE